MATIETEYWALKPNRDLVEELVKRRKDFAGKILETGYLEKSDRSWNYYHGQYFSDSAPSTSAIKMSDSDSGDALANINYTRAIIDQHVTYVVSEKPAWDARAVNSDNKSREKAILFNNLCDSYMEFGGLDQKCDRLARYAAVLSSGFMYISWDLTKGREIRPDESMQQMIYSGDFNYEVLKLTDVAWDITHPDFEEAPYVQVKTLRNRWDLCKLYPQHVDAILAAPNASEDGGDYSQVGDIGLTSETTDFVNVWEVWFRPSIALPQGRHVAYVDDKEPLAQGDEAEPNPYGVIPLVRLIPGEFLTTCLGYSFSFDMQIPQETYGAGLSALLTSFNILGQPRLFVDENSNVQIEDLEPGSGIRVIKGIGGKEPKELKFDVKLGENAEVLQIAKGEMGEMAGIGPASRGSMEGLPKNTPAATIALLDSKAVQSTQVFGKWYRLALGKIATTMLRIAKVHAREPRMIAMAGKKNKGKMLRWSAEDLDAVETVVVEAASPLQRSLAGKVQLADSLANRAWINTKEEYLTVIETGQVESLTESLDSQLAAIADENDRLRDGAETAGQLLQAMQLAQAGGDMMLQDQIGQYLQSIGVVAMATDNQILHIRRHPTLFDSSESRMNQGIIIPAGAHIKQHLDFLNDPEIQRQQLIQGYMTPEVFQQFLASKQVPYMGMNPMPSGPLGTQPGGSQGPSRGIPANGLPPEAQPARAPSTSPRPQSETGVQPQIRRVSPKFTQAVTQSNLG